MLGVAAKDWPAMVGRFQHPLVIGDLLVTRETDSRSPLESSEHSLQPHSPTDKNRPTDKDRCAETSFLIDDDVGLAILGEVDNSCPLVAVEIDVL